MVSFPAFQFPDPAQFRIQPYAEHLILTVERMLTRAVALRVVLPAKRLRSHSKVHDLLSVSPRANVVLMVHLRLLATYRADFVDQTEVQIPRDIRRAVDGIVRRGEIVFNAKLNQKLQEIIRRGHGTVRQAKPLRAGSGNVLAFEDSLQFLGLVAGENGDVPDGRVDFLALVMADRAAII